MVFKMNELVSFNRDCQQLFKDKLPLTLAYKISKIEKAMEGDLQFYQDKYVEIITKYGDKDEQGNLKYSEDGLTVLVGETEKREKAQIEINELLSMDINLAIEDYLPELSDFDKNKMVSMAEISGLLPFIK